MPRNEVFALIDELTLNLRNAKKMPFTDSVLVKQDDFTEALKRIVTNYDPSLEQADKIIRNEESIIAEATEAANKSMANAQAQAQGMVSEANSYAQKTKEQADNYTRETTQQAEENARAILADAQNRAQHIVEDAKAQADELVSQTTVLARAEAQAREMLENATQHIEGLKQQVQHDLNGLLDHVDAAISVQLNDIRILKQNVAGSQGYEGEDERV